MDGMKGFSVRGKVRLTSSLCLHQAGVINDLVLLSCVGIRPVFVHGGGPEINTWLEKLGIKAEFKNGLRVTDGELLCPEGLGSAFRKVYDQTYEQILKQRLESTCPSMKPPRQ